MMRAKRRNWWVVPVLVACAVMAGAQVGHGEELRVLFLGDAGHHQPRARFDQLQPALARRGIDLVYTDKTPDLTAETLAGYDALLLYANIDAIEPAAAQALLDYVAGGGGFVPLHCATYCFRNSPELVQLMGAQFERHGTGVFRTQIAEPDHPLMKGFGGFESWDETYVHRLHNEKNRTVLEYRVDADGREPWTWVRTHGKGRVFYTAWGHDERTWGNPGFQNLVERGIRWAAGNDPGQVPDFVSQDAFPVPRMKPQRQDVEPFEYVDVGAKIPNYVPSEKWGEQAEPHSKMQQPLAAGRVDQAPCRARGLSRRTVRRRARLGRQADCHELGRARPAVVAKRTTIPTSCSRRAEGRDRIRICEDTDGDGRADKFTVFAEKLSIPTALLACRGGVIVQDGARNAVSQRHRRRRPGRRARTCCHRLGYRRHARRRQQFPLRPGQLDLGHAGLQPLAAGGQRQAGCKSSATGSFAFGSSDNDPPQVAELEFLRSTNNNTWGLGISEEGLVFGSTANHNPERLHADSQSLLRTRARLDALARAGHDRRHALCFRPITDKVRQVDHFGGYTAGAGHALYTARQYPERVLESHGVRLRADGPSRRHVRADADGQPTFIRPARSICWPATTSGPRRSWPRSGPTATCG